MSLTPRSKKAGALLTLTLLTALLGVPAPVLAEPDVAEGHEFVFTRMPGFHICEFQTKDFEKEVFLLAVQGKEDPDETTKEGRRVQINYCLNSGAQEPSLVELGRNFLAALKKLNGTVRFYNEGRDLTASFEREGKEIWVKFMLDGGGYVQTTIQVGAMEEKIDLVTADAMKSALDKDGRVALYIHFDSGQAVIKPASAPTIEQIVKLLQADKKLRLDIEGHTDSKGTAAGNKTLSEQRAQAVVAALVEKSIEPDRLSARGLGQEKPLADNGTEEGRAKNRRVELVKAK